MCRECRMTKRKHLKRRVRDRRAKTGESYAAALRHVRNRAQEAKDMSTETVQDFALACSFCRKSSQQVKKLIAGPGVYICDECIGLCNGIIEGEGADASAPDQQRAPSLDDAPLDRLLAIFRAMATTARSMDANLTSWARKLRERGVTVDQLAQAAAMSDEEAVRRFNL